jgi:hypothetical protein
MVIFSFAIEKAPDLSDGAMKRTILIYLSIPCGSRTLAGLKIDLLSIGLSCMRT